MLTSKPELNPTKAGDTIHAIVKHGLAAALKRAGFRKSGLAFARRSGATAHFIQIQRSSWNQGADGAFYINIGIMFDDIRRHFGRDVPTLPKHDDCDFIVRLERIVPDAPAHWPISEATDVQQISEKLLGHVMVGVVQPLDALHCLGDFEGTGWMEVIPWGLPAIHAYLMGRYREATCLVSEEAAFFRDRGASYEALLKTYRFSKLQENPGSP